GAIEKDALIVGPFDKAEGGWWILDADGANPREVYRREGETSSDSACWSPDGKRVALVLFDWIIDEKGNRTLRPEKNKNFRLARMDGGGKNRREVSLENMKLLFLNDPEWR